jgi:hypothetical protein
MPIEEDYPGQADEHRRHLTIERAVSAADTVIMEGSGGDTEETDFLTGMVALKFVEKVNHRLVAQLHRKDLMDRLEPKKRGHG